MPGFIVNHAGRGMNTEGLRVAQEAVASFAQVDAIMREQAGFRMGPFELLDLTALDVSHPVMESIYRQFYDEARFRPRPSPPPGRPDRPQGRRRLLHLCRRPEAGAGRNARAGPAADPEDLGQPQASRRLCARHRAAGKAGRAADLRLPRRRPTRSSSSRLTARTCPPPSRRRGLDPARSVGLDTRRAGRREAPCLMLSPATQPHGATRPMPRWLPTGCRSP